jgi:hypothetical protein
MGRILFNDPGRSLTWRSAESKTVYCIDQSVIAKVGIFGEKGERAGRRESLHSACICDGVMRVKRKEVRCGLFLSFSFLTYIRTFRI